MIEEERARLAIVEALQLAGVAAEVAGDLLVQHDLAMKAAHLRGYREATVMAMLCATNGLMGGVC